LTNDYYSSIKIHEDLSPEFSTFIFKGSNEKATHLVGFSGSSAKILAEFKKSLSGPDWDLYSAELNTIVESKYSTAGNRTVGREIASKQKHTIFHGWMYKVKDVTNFTKTL